MRLVYRGAAVAAVLVLVLSAVAEAQWTWTPQTGRWVNLNRLPKETPELQIEYARGLMIQGNAKKALRETNKFTEFYGDSPLADQNQFLRGEIRMSQDKLLDAAKEFQQLIAGYPNTSLYDEAIAKQYEIGDTYYDKGLRKMDKRWALFKKRPLNRAIDVYAMVVENQPFTAAAAEAQYKIGLCHYVREEYIEAAYEYRRVMEDYAGSDWVDEATYGMAVCYYAASLPPDYDQTPSQLAIIAIDDFSAKYPSDERIGELTEKRQEMRDSIAEQRIKVAKFYERRRNFDSARLYYQVVVEQFSDTPFVNEAQAWLEANPVPPSIAERAAMGSGS